MNTEASASSGAPSQGEDRRKNKNAEEYFNAQFEASPTYVQPGEVVCTDREDEMLVSTVGAGVLLSCYDQELKLGLMSYIVLPTGVLDTFPFLDKADQTLVKKAFQPLEDAIQQMQNRGAAKNRLRIRLFGGVIREDDEADRGLKNTVFVQEYLFRKGLQVFNADVGGPFIRRVHFFPTTGRAVRRLLKRADDYAQMDKLEYDFNQNITTSD